jgi:hypothetical protein
MVRPPQLGPHLRAQTQTVQQNERRTGNTLARAHSSRRHHSLSRRRLRSSRHLPVQVPTAGTASDYSTPVPHRCGHCPASSLTACGAVIEPMGAHRCACVRVRAHGKRRRAYSLREAVPAWTRAEYYGVLLPVSPINTFSTCSASLAPSSGYCRCDSWSRASTAASSWHHGLFRAGRQWWCDRVAHGTRRHGGGSAESERAAATKSE